MARPKQDGLLYFSFDTDFFYADKRIKRLHSRYGSDGLIIYIYLLAEIYRKGYYIRWDKETAEDIADDLHLTEGLTEQVLTFLVSRSLLYKSTLANSDTIITSPGIQKRYQEAVKGRKRQIEVDPEIWLLDEKETASCIKVTHNTDFSEKNPNKSEKNMSKSGKNPLKESKGKESKENKNRECVCRIEEFISAYPKKSNRYLTEIAYVNLVMEKVETEDRLIECAKNYAEACLIERIPERYIKNAENFLRDFAFEKYLPGKYVKPKGSPNVNNRFHNFEQRDTDYDSIVMDRLKERLEGRQQT